MRRFVSRISPLFFLPFIVLGLFFMFSPATFAQVVPRFTANDISLDVTPPNPDAFTTITLKLETFSIDLDIHFITWMVNDQEKTSGIGKKSITVQVGAYGESTNVVAIIKSQDGRLVRKSIVLRPATVDVLWEAVDSYVPPFYKGKALPARGAVIKFTAMPNLVMGDIHLRPTDLDYTWQWNYKVKDNASGYNKQSMAIKNLFINREEVVSVKVKNSQATVGGEGSTKLTFAEPQIIFYNLFPTTRALDIHAALYNNYTSQKNPIELGIAPFFFSVRPDQTIDSLLYQWRVNNEIVASDQSTNKNLLLIAPQGRGGVRIQADVKQPDEDFQQESTNINLQL